MILLTAAEMREYDRATIEDVGIPGMVLMELAGRGCAEVCQKYLRKQFPLLPIERANISIVCGAGNNGGDGYVIARHLQNAGAKVSTYLLSPPANLQGDAKKNYEILKKTGGRIIDASATDALASLPMQKTLEKSDLLVDAILGTGLTRDVREDLAKNIRLLDGLPCAKIAVDIPSGIDSDTGTIRGAAIRVNATVTFGQMKRGHWLYPGREFSGKVHLVDISIPREMTAQVGATCHLLSESLLRKQFPRRAKTSYKNTFGHLVLVAGSPGKGGAALLSATSALRSGAGLVTLATSRSCQKSLEGYAKEVMVEPVGSGEDVLQAASLADLSSLFALFSGKQALAIGPGLGQDEKTFSLARRLVKEAPLPAVVDADALNAVAKDKTCLRDKKAARILTPHPREMARLLGRSTVVSGEERTKLVLEFAREHSVVLVLKGADTMIAGPAGEFFINSTGNPGLATAGSGDVLTGIIGAFLAQDLSPIDAACLGVYLHGRAADVARKKVGETAMIASDVVKTLPKLLKRWERNIF